jgi:hypothetical protein
MGLELTTPETVPLKVEQLVPYTHVVMVGLVFKFPAAGQEVAAEIIWRKGTLDGAGKFQILSQHSTEVPETPVRNWLTAKDTSNRANFIKLEEAMYAYLNNAGEVAAGTVVVIPE